MTGCMDIFFLYCCCLSRLSVKGVVGGTPPVLTACPANISLTTAGTSATATWTAPTATDACPGIVLVTTTNAIGSSFPLGTTTVTYTAKDAANNMSTCSFTVTVTQTTTNQPDLTLANLNFSGTSVPVGAILNFNFDLKISAPPPRRAILISKVICPPTMCFPPMIFRMAMYRRAISAPGKQFYRCRAR